MSYSSVYQPDTSTEGKWKTTEDKLLINFFEMSRVGEKMQVTDEQGFGLNATSPF